MSRYRNLSTHSLWRVSVLLHVAAGLSIPRPSSLLPLEIRTDGGTGASPSGGSAIPAAVFTELQSAQAATCLAGENGVAPFNYWKLTDVGTLVPATPTAALNGLCSYPDASCIMNGLDAQCCNMTSANMKGYITADMISTMSGLSMTLGMIVAVRWWRSQLMRSPPVVTRGAVPPPPAPTPAPGDFGFIWLYVGTGFSIASAVVMASWTQISFTLPERNAMLAADAFLTPVSQVFLFLEDAVSVKTGFAIGARDIRGIRTITNVGFWGGLLLGAFAATCTTLLSLWPAGFERVLVPSQQALPGCSLLPEPEAVVYEARALWLLMSWSWPLSFASMALSGFLLGTQMYTLWGMSTTISRIIYMAVFALPQTRSLALYGWATFISSAVLLVLYTLSAAFVSVMHREHARAAEANVQLGPQAADTTAEEEELFHGLADFWNSMGGKSIRQGMQAMALDVCVQLGITSGVYLTASRQGLAAMYQLSALQAALPTYGLAWSAGVAYSVKLAGSVLVGGGLYWEFRRIAWVVPFLAVLSAAIGTAATVPYSTPLAYFYSQEACVYASNPACMSLYSEIFGGNLAGTGSVQHTFRAFVFAVVASCIMNVARAGLYVTFDFAFMAKAGLASLLFLYVPAVLVATFWIKRVDAIYGAMYLPSMVLSVVFLYRFHGNAQRMAAGEDGPWAAEAAGDKEGSRFTTGRR